MSSFEGKSMALASNPLDFRNLVLSFSLLLIAIFHQGCATKQPLPPPPPIVDSSPKMIVVSFGANPGGTAPDRTPSTGKEWALCALFEYDHGNFAEAAKAFEEASKAIVNPGTHFARETLIAQAVCYLRDANDSGFSQAMETLLSSYNRWELSQVRARDPRLRILEQIYHQRTNMTQR